MVSRRRRELGFIHSRDPARPDAEEVSIPPKEAEAAAAAAAGGEFTAAIIYGTALATATFWTPLFPPHGTGP